jgi:hypothetical protein
LNLTNDKQLSSLAFTFNLYRYSLDACPTTTVADGFNNMSMVWRRSLNPG